LPNCNGANVNTCNSPNNGCGCTLGAGMNSDCSSGGFCAEGCLDKDGTSSQIVDLRNKGIQTIVVGFGSDFAGPGVDTLNNMAEAGGFPRRCPNGTDVECGTGNSCNVAQKLCNVKFYKAGNAAELSAELAKISSALNNVDPCVFALDSQPTPPNVPIVYVNGANIPAAADTWAYTGGTVTFAGKICSDIKASTPSTSVKISIRIIETF
jgi:hypothetical protein